jgi:hypothetical protein
VQPAHAVDSLPFFKVAEVRFTGPKWREIKTAVIRKTLYGERTRRRRGILPYEMRVAKYIKIRTVSKMLQSLNGHLAVLVITQLLADYTSLC